MPEKGRKDSRIGDNMPHQGGEIEIADMTRRLVKCIDPSGGGNDMGRTGKSNEPPKKDDGKSKKAPPAATEDSDYEDGDIATPKRDRYGDDDQPL
jgi:hypothetical protein